MKGEKMSIHTTQKWVEKFIDNEEQKQMLLRACNIFDYVAEKEDLTVKDIEPIVDVAINKYMAV